MMPIERRRELLEYEITLNGVRATIGGVNNDFATIRQLPDGLVSAEFAWPTVEHVITNNDGAFNA
jgi:hypothetical protein